jgi:hypothetical protein
MKSGASAYAGMWQVVRFNPGFYLAVAVLVPAATLGLMRWGDRLPIVLVWGAAGGMGLAAWWGVASLVASHWVYDRSDWPRGDWLRRWMGTQPPRRVLNVHAGFDETTERLQRWLPGTECVVLDLYDPTVMTEPSVQRARAARPAEVGTVTGTLARWPELPGRFDLICLLLTAHEFRKPAERQALLKRLAGLLAATPGSSVLLAEHLRDPANFAVYGPGFLHFHSPATWERDWRQAGLRATASLRITPWIRVWKLEKASP